MISRESRFIWGTTLATSSVNDLKLSSNASVAAEEVKEELRELAAPEIESIRKKLKLKKGLK